MAGQETQTLLLLTLGNEKPPGVATADVLAIVELESRPSQNQIGIGGVVLYSWFSFVTVSSISPNEY